MIRVRRAVSVMVAALVALVVVAPSPAMAENWVPVTGSGSTWSQNALDQWRRNVAANYGMTVNYSGTGSTAGRLDFINRTVDFAISEIPFQRQPEDFSAPEIPSVGYAYMPIVAGGTSFMYNLKIGGKRVTNLRLSGDTVTKIFTGMITKWNDPAIAADNPGLAMPDRAIVPVVRSDGSGTSAQFTLWMSKQYPQLWQDFCGKVGRASACGMTSQYPVFGSAKAQKGSDGVAGYVSQAYGEGAITYVEYSYARKAGLPVAKLLNKMGYYIEPTAQAVAVAMLRAQINEDPNSPDYLTQILDGVYNSEDPRAYPLSSYSYLIVPTAAAGIFTAEKGHTLAAFVNYMICEGQQQADQLGYSPLPMNLVQAGATQIARIPGAGPVDINACNNPTFKPGDSPDSNQLALTAPQPLDCDKQGSTQCGPGGVPTQGGGGGESPAGGGGGTPAGGGDGSPTGGGGESPAGGGGGSPTGGGGGSPTGGGATDTGGDGLPQDAAYDEFGNLLPATDTGGTSGDLGGSGGGGANGSGAQAVSSPFTMPPAGSGWLSRVMGGAAALLVALVTLPPVLSRRMRATDRRVPGRPGS